MNCDRNNVVRKSSSSRIVASIVMAVCLLSTNAAAQKDEAPRLEKATLAAGCFWCVEAVFERLEGVQSVVAGFAGGTEPNPTGKQVSSGKTGHAEVVQITYDPAKINFNKLLEVFWKAHDPTTLNRQGADVGPQYRSAIFYDGDEQKRAAERSKEEAQEMFADPIVTEIVELDEFYKAGDYHQDYYKNNPNAPYCLMVIKPKLKKLKLED